MKRLLVITSYYPPLAGISSTRVASFVRHLPKYGWEVSVVTVDWQSMPVENRDVSSDGEELQRAVCYRAPVPDVIKREKSFWPPMFRWSVVAMNPVAWAEQLKDQWKYGVAVFGNRFFIRAAKKFLSRQLKDNRYDVILASSPDLGPQVVASDLSKEFGVPWVADCRDDYAVFKEGQPVYLDVERGLIQSAAMAVTVSNGLKEEIGKRCGCELRVVENGYEEQNFNVQENEVKRIDVEKFNVVYTGSLAMYYPGRHSPEAFFRAVDLLLEKYPDAQAGIRVHFFGDTAAQPILDKYMLKMPRLKGVLKSHGSVPRREACQLQQAADLLLILAHPGRKGILTGKVFEYLAARRPIVCVPGDGDELDDMLERTRAGKVFTTPKDAAIYLESAYKQWRDRGCVECDSDMEEVRRYDRYSLAGKMDSILSEVAGKNESSESVILDR